MPKLVNPPALGEPRGYSNGVLYPPGSLLFIAGQIGWDGDQKLVEGGFVAQFRQALFNLMAVVEASGGSATSIGRLTIFVTDKALYLEDLKAVGRAYREVLGSHYPAMSLVEVADLLEEGALVEIEGTAVV